MNMYSFKYNIKTPTLFSFLSFCLFENACIFPLLLKDFFLLSIEF